MNNNLLSNRFTLISAVALLAMASSCSVFRPGTTSGSSGSPATAPAGNKAPATKSGSGEGRFLTTISTDNAAGESDPDAGTSGGRSTSGRNDRKRIENSPLYRSKEIRSPALPPRCRYFS